MKEVAIGAFGSNKKAWSLATITLRVGLRRVASGRGGIGSGEAQEAWDSDAAEGASGGATGSRRRAGGEAAARSAPDLAQVDEDHIVRHQQCRRGVCRQRRVDSPAGQPTPQGARVGARAAELGGGSAAPPSQQAAAAGRFAALLSPQVACRQPRAAQQLAALQVLPVGDAAGVDAHHLSGGGERGCASPVSLGCGLGTPLPAGCGRRPPPRRPPSAGRQRTSACQTRAG